MADGFGATRTHRTYRLWMRASISTPRLQTRIIPSFSRPIQPGNANQRAVCCRAASWSSVLSRTFPSARTYRYSTQPLYKDTLTGERGDRLGHISARYSVCISQEGHQLTLECLPDETAVGNDDALTATTTATFHASWLWSNDPSHIHATSGQRLRSPNTYFSTQAKILSAQVIVLKAGQKTAFGVSPPIAPPKGSLHPVGGVYRTQPRTTHTVDTGDRTLLSVTWVLPNENDTTVSSLYDVPWLLQCQYDKDALISRQRDAAVTKTMALCAGETLVSLPFRDLVEHSSEETRRHSKFQLLKEVWQKGAVIVSNTRSRDPPESQDADTAAVALAGKALSGGRLSHGHLYGDVFCVQAIQDPHNIAYTNVALCPHQDFPYVSSPPGLQLLHCVANSAAVQGGASTLMDAVAAAEEFRRLAPGLFEILVQCDATFVKQRDGADLVYRRPHIALDATGSHVVSVRWAPPFEGPLALDPRLVDDYYVAYTAFERMLDNAFPRLCLEGPSRRHRLLPKISASLEMALCDYAHTYTWEQRLVPGEILVFNNQRMLHGRRAFSIGTSHSNDGVAHRLLMGCYLNMDDTLSEYRLLRRERYQGQSLPPVPCVGDGNSFVL